MSDKAGMSMETKLATLQVTLENFTATFLERFGRQDKTLERIEEQTTHTNGRVNITEENIRNLNRLSTESIVEAGKLREAQSRDHASIGRIKRQFWRWSATLVILGAIGMGVVWCLDHGVLSFKPESYHALGQ